MFYIDDFLTLYTDFTKVVKALTNTTKVSANEVLVRQKKRPHYKDYRRNPKQFKKMISKFLEPSFEDMACMLKNL